MTTMRRQSSSHSETVSWLCIVLMGIISAVHIWKLPPSLDSLSSELGIELVQAGILIGIIQVASIIGGLPTAWMGERLGLRRVILAGMVLLSFGSILGALASSPAMIFISRAVEGIGFLFCVVLGPALLRDRFEPPHVHRALTAWATFQGLAAFIGFTVGTFVVPEFGWRPMWIGAACITVLLIPFVIFLVPKDPAGSVGDAAASGATKTWQLVRVTISRPGPWLAGAIFACYSIQWMAVLGFLPRIYEQYGIQQPGAGLMSAFVGGVNIVGALGAGVLAHKGVKEKHLLVGALGAMAVTSFGLFAIPWQQTSHPALATFLFAVAFSAIGGAAPMLLTRMIGELAQPNGSSAVVMGLMQQIFNLGNFLGPFLIAWFAVQTGGWESSWMLTGTFSLLGIVGTMILLKEKPEREG
ncbi:hypothetical protein HMPREF3175_06000 [Arthrobacter sp. HMSC08H08]|nr:hypothetical protein HMPREF3175_06000 [Arthrobacter sp. HMSC08H08]